MFKKTSALINSLREVLYDNFSIVSFLPYQNEFQCCIAIILSYRTRDIVTRKVCIQLFRNILVPRDILCLTVNELHMVIRSVNYSFKKTHYIRKVSKIMWKSTNSSFILHLGNKTRDICSNNFYFNSSIAIDSNIFRLLSRITGQKLSYKEAQQILSDGLSSSEKFFASHSYIQFSRRVCKTNPLCEVCKIKDACHYWRLKNETTILRKT